MHAKCKIKSRAVQIFLLIQIAVAGLTFSAAAADDLSWPPISREQRPWAYWWWMASAVDPANITKELTRYHDAGMGGVHIIPIYGAKGWETNYITYLSPKWMEMLRYTVKEADRLGLGVDMTTGSGWCFGGPRVTDEEANATVVVTQAEVSEGTKPEGSFDRKTTQALMAFGPNNQKTDLLRKINADGTINWTAPAGTWRVFAVSQKPSGQKVKRAGPGGEGHMLNLFYPRAMTNFLGWFSEAFTNYSGPRPRAQYHDSYEYRSDWAPDFFAQFERLRGYRLQDELPALFGNQTNEYTGRVKCDYRETISDLMSEVTLPLWVKWSHDHGFITRNEAHGSPGNLLDLYALADVPETEMFHSDRNKLISKFSSSAAHVMGRPLSSSETGTWLEEHFTETLADMKYLQDDLFLSGVNHIFYHGTCYSPDEAGWPGWLFYASFQMNPRNAIWRDVPALNAYAARCQAVLQAGRSDNDVLLYWPIADRWSDPAGLVQPMTVHARDWFEAQPIGKAAEWLWNRGYQFDYVSDHQLAAARVIQGAVVVPGGSYRVVVVPKCQYMPVQTFRKLMALVKAGATVIFQDQLPKSPSGFGELADRQMEFKSLLARADLLTRSAKRPSDRILVGGLEPLLKSAEVPRETLFDRPGLMCVRRQLKDGSFYFIANRGEKPVDGFVPIANRMRSAAIFDPMTGRTGTASTRVNGTDGGEVRLQLAPGQSVVLRVFANRWVKTPAWSYREAAGAPIALTGTWQVKFLQGGPELPAPFETATLASWTQSSDTNAQNFAGTALYALEFDAPADGAEDSWLDLGDVRQSARVRLNGRDLGTLFTPPFRVVADKLRPKDNVLEVEVTNVSANRIRDLDRRGVVWRNFRDINFVNLNYRPFDASNWPLTDSGLIGPVTLTPVRTAAK